MVSPPKGCGCGHTEGKSEWRTGGSLKEGMGATPNIRGVQLVRVTASLAPGSACAPSDHQRRLVDAVPNRTEV